MAWRGFHTSCKPHKNAFQLTCNFVDEISFQHLGIGRFAELVHVKDTEIEKEPGTEKDGGLVNCHVESKVPITQHPSGTILKIQDLAGKILKFERLADKIIEISKSCTQLTIALFFVFCFFSPRHAKL